MPPLTLAEEACRRQDWRPITVPRGGEPAEFGCCPVSPTASFLAAYTNKTGTPVSRLSMPLPRPSWESWLFLSLSWTGVFSSCRAVDAQRKPSATVGRLHRAEASIGSAIRSAANVPRTGASRWSDQTGRSESRVPLIGSSLVYPVPRCHQQEQVYGSQDQRKTGSPLCKPSRNDRAMQPRQRAGMVVAAGLGRDEITVIGRYGGHGPAGSVPDPTSLNVNRPNSSDLHRLTRAWPGSRAQDLPMSSRFFAHRFFNSVLCNACPSAPAPSGSPHSTVKSQTRGSESHLHRPRPKQPK